MKISIIIKALNEEAHIEGAVTSALAAIEGLDGEVILADSLSDDATVAIAARYPIVIVQLETRSHRSCGVGPQLGYQVARGDYVYILDGDMEIHRPFLLEAIAMLDADTELAGVAGAVEMVGGASYEFKTRRTKPNRYKATGDQPWLVEGGLYRRAALDAVGYFSHRYLHANEEKELGLRLGAGGWRLTRIGTPAIVHYVHNDDSSAMLARRWRSHYVDGPGELLRSAVGKPYFRAAIKSSWKSIAVLGFWAWLLMTILMAPWLPTLLIFTLLGVMGYFVMLWARKGDFWDAWSSILTTQVFAAGLLRGFLMGGGDPREKIPYKIIKADAWQ